MGDIVLAGATSGTITVQPTAVAGSNTLTLPAANATVLTSTSPSSDLPSSINGPAFAAYMSTATQSISNASFTKVQFNTEIFDTNNNYDPTTNYRFTPTVAGYYQINATIIFANAASGRMIHCIFKNGSEYARLSNLNLATTSGVRASGGAVIYMNGSTDYLELFVYQDSGGALNISGSDAITAQWSGVMVRSA